VISQEFRNVPDYQSAVIAKQLLEAGIETVYIADDIIKNYHQFEYAYFYPDNDHPSDTVQNIISDELAKRIARYHLPKNLDASKIEYKRLTGIKNSVLSSQYPANCDIGSNTAGSAVQNRAVFYNGYLLPSKTGGKKNSPVFVFGNSYIETPMLYPDSLPTLLASKILLTVDSDRIGSILPVSSTIQKIFHNPEFYLRNRVVVILQMGAKHFYAQWSDISQMDQNLTGK